MVDMQKRLSLIPMLISNMQKFLMMKEHECGPLKTLLSRATEETSKNIDRIVQGIVEIYDSYDLLPLDKLNMHLTSVDLKADPPVVSSLQFFLMNTNFHTQHRLAEDALRGHQVGMLPTLSPYLLIQIIWSLQCEDLLPRFILCTPLELSIEILTHVTSCLSELEFKRATNLVVQLVHYVYKYIYRLGTIGTEVCPCEEHIYQLLASFQELLDQLMNPRLTRLPDLPEQLIYVRQGIILKCIICINKLCSTERVHGGTHENMDGLYILTFGSEVREKVPSELLKSCINEMDKSVITLLMKHLKQVNCNMYLAWVEVEDQENPLLSLQRAIITECLYFQKTIKIDSKLQEHKELHICLDQLIGSHKQPQLTLQEIYNGIQSGQLMDMKDLLVRYREWNELTLQFIYNWDNLLQIENFEALFKYLKYTFSIKHYTKEQKLKLQLTVMKIILKRRVNDIYDITLMYVLHHYNDTFLQELYNRDRFYSLMRQLTGAWENPFFFKALLIHILHSPKEVLMTLISMSISKSDEFVCSPQQLLSLRPFLCLKISNVQSFLSEMLYQLSLKPHLWSVHKYTHFIIAMLKSLVTSPEDLIYNVFIRYLVEQPFNLENVVCVLVSIYKIVDSYKPKNGMMELCIVIGRKISNWRKCEPTKRRGDVYELLSQLLFVMKKCTHESKYLTVRQKRLVLDTIISHIEPLDKAVFSPLLYMMESSILTIIDDYTRRCRTVRQKYRQARRQNLDMREFIDSIQLEKQDFVRHMILHATATEYQQYCVDMISKYWFFFGWLNEMDAYDNVTRITMEAIRIGLEHPENVPFDNFTVLLKFCMRLTEVIVWKSIASYEHDIIIKILLKNMSPVTKSIQHKEQLKAYKIFLANLKNTMEIQGFWMEFCNFIEYTLRLEKQNDAFNQISLRNPDISTIYDSYTFICACFSILGTEKHHGFIEKLEEMMFSEEDSCLNYNPL